VTAAIPPQDPQLRGEGRADCGIVLPRAGLQETKPHQFIDLDRVDLDDHRAPAVDAASAHASRPKANKIVAAARATPAAAPTRPLYRYDRDDEWRRRPRPQFRPNAAPNEVVWPARSTVQHYRIPIGGSRAARRGRTLVSGSMPAGTR
jgi:hypothetical protein